MILIYKSDKPNSFQKGNDYFYFEIYVSVTIPLFKTSSVSSFDDVIPAYYIQCRKTYNQ